MGPGCIFNDQCDIHVLRLILFSGMQTPNGQVVQHETKVKFKAWTALKKKPAFNRMVYNNWNEDTLEEIREFICDPAALEEAQKVMNDVCKKLELWMKKKKVSKSTHFLNLSDNASMMSNSNIPNQGHQTPDMKLDWKPSPNEIFQTLK